MVINNGLQGAGAARQAGLGAFGAAKTTERLSSGLRIGGAKDDAAGLAISEKMRGQVRGFNTASRNTSDAISLVRTAEGSLSQTHSALHRMRELAVQASNGIYTDSDRQNLQAEFGQLQSEITRIGNATEFNTMALLDGSRTQAAAPAAEGGGPLTFQTGANSGQSVSASINDMRSSALGIDALSVGTQSGAMSSLEAIDAAIESVSRQRGELGATENRFDHTVRNLDTAAENQQAAESRIRDADMAREMIQNTINNIRQQTSLAMVTQANMAQQSVLRLLG